MMVLLPMASFPSLIWASQALVYASLDRRHFMGQLTLLAHGFTRIPGVTCSMAMGTTLLRTSIPTCSGAQ